jgi:hypothetical protein
MIRATTPMIPLSLKTMYRHLVKHKIYSLISVTGLAAGFRLQDRTDALAISHGRVLCTHDCHRGGVCAGASCGYGESGGSAAVRMIWKENL